MPSGCHGRLLPGVRGTGHRKQLRAAAVRDVFLALSALPLAHHALIAFIFLIQIGIDLISPLFIHHWGDRACILLAHGFSARGLILLAFLPDLLDPFTGILISVAFYAVSGGHSGSNGQPLHGGLPLPPARKRP
jgi:hypothetical protein